jgi:hypothetical protein
MGQADFFRTIDGLQHLADILAQPSWFEDPSEEKAFIGDVQNQHPTDRKGYEDICDGYQFQGHIVDINDIPASVCRLMHGEALNEMCRRWLLFDLPPSVQESASESTETPGWQRFDEWINDHLPAAVSGQESVHLGGPGSGSVFVTFREIDPGSDRTNEPGILSDAVAEGQTGWSPGGIPGRLAHRIAVEWEFDRIDYVGLLWYDSDCYDCFRIPIPPDAGGHKYFRPVQPGSDTYGRTRPDLMSDNGRACPFGRDCRDCMEAELVHENRDITVENILVALMRTES